MLCLPDVPVNAVGGGRMVVVVIKDVQEEVELPFFALTACA